MLGIQLLSPDKFIESGVQRYFQVQLCTAFAPISSIAVTHVTL